MNNMENKIKVYFRGCLKNSKNPNQIVWYDKTIKFIEGIEFEHVVDFDKHTYSKYNKLLKYNDLHYLEINWKKIEDDY